MKILLHKTAGLLFGIKFILFFRCQGHNFVCRQGVVFFAVSCHANDHSCIGRCEGIIIGLTQTMFYSRIAQFCWLCFQLRPSWLMPECSHHSAASARPLPRPLSGSCVPRRQPPAAMLPAVATPVDTRI